ncbi:hypothetical protein D3C81_09060 [compost metagenome]
MFDLKKQPTRILLKWLAKARKCGSGYDPTENGGNEISIVALKAELATREHVPNKHEAKAIRRAKKERGK